MGNLILNISATLDDTELIKDIKNKIKPHEIIEKYDYDDVSGSLFVHTNQFVHYFCLLDYIEIKSEL